jgi:hypothetical protein
MEDNNSSDESMNNGNVSHLAILFKHAMDQQAGNESVSIDTTYSIVARIDAEQAKGRKLFLNWPELA